MTSGPDADMNLGIASLRSAVKRKFSAAHQSKDLIFSDTEVTILKTRHGVPFQLRYCPALSKKPTDNKPPPKQDDKKPPKPKFDPFANPSPELLIARIPAVTETHNLVLNKFPVIPNHFILATKDNLPQTDLLDPADLATTYACLQAWRNDHSNSDTTTTITSSSNDLFAFFNSGPHSGASQPHRHLQFLSVSDMQLGLSSHDTSTWQPLINHDTADLRTLTQQPHQIDHSPYSPFLLLSTPLHPTLTPSSLHARYLTLLRAAQHLTTSNPTTQPTASTLFSLSSLSSTPITAPPDSKHVALSYNLALTTERMAIVPRRAEAAAIPGLKGSEVAMNGTILGGTLMVREWVEWERLLEGDRMGEGVLDEMLGQVGFQGVGGEGEGGGRGEVGRL